ILYRLALPISVRFQRPSAETGALEGAFELGAKARRGRGVLCLLDNRLALSPRESSVSHAVHKCRSNLSSRPSMASGETTMSSDAPTAGELRPTTLIVSSQARSGDQRRNFGT